MLDFAGFTARLRSELFAFLFFARWPTPKSVRVEGECWGNPPWPPLGADDAPALF